MSEDQNIEESEFTIEDMAAWDWIRRMHQRGYAIRKDAPQPLREALGMCKTLIDGFEIDPDNAAKYAPTVLLAIMGAIEYGIADAKSR